MSQRQIAAPDNPSGELLRGLPENIDAERFILGSVLLDDSRFITVAAALEVEDFALEKHRRIFRRMCELNVRGSRIDRVTVADELSRCGELQSVDGLSYIVSLDDGMPQIANIDSYTAIVKAKSMLRRIARTGQYLMNRALAGADDPALILSDVNTQLMSITAEDNRLGPVTVRDIIDDFAGGINNLLDPSKQPKGLRTGFARLDTMTGGLQRGELFILAARPSMGKTALALNIAENITLRADADPARPVVVFSLEMQKESLLRRSLCSVARVDSQRFRAGFLDERERTRLRKAAQRLYDAPLLIDDKSTLGVVEMFSRCQRIIAERGGLGLVVVDYIQLVSGGTGGKSQRPENRQQEVSLISRLFKLMAKELDVPLLVLSQLSRAPEGRPGDHRPQLSDLRESGALEQDADAVGFVYREEYYKRDREDLRGLAELILAKQRNGPVGNIDLVFQHAQTRFENRLQDLDDGPPPAEGPPQNFNESKQDWE